MLAILIAVPLPLPVPWTSGRYDLAAAFFLLSGSAREAVGVLAHERGDPQLALVVARLAEGGPGGPIASRIIQEVGSVNDTTHIRV